jgi:hypothetical protein
MTPEEIEYFNRHKRKHPSKGAGNIAVAFVLLSVCFVGYRIVQHLIKSHREEVANPITVYLDVSGRASTIDFPAKCSRIIFSAADMNGEEFAKALVNSYNIPKMDWTHTANGVGCWEFVSPENVRFRASEKKQLFMERIADARSRQSNFN